MKLTRRSKSSALWIVASLLALLYFATSLVVVINSYVWMATFPSFWYAMQRVIYWPFQPYWDFTLSFLGGSDIPYQTYALISRSPFLVIPLLVWLGALRHAVSRKASGPASITSEGRSVNRLFEGEKTC